MKKVYTCFACGFPIVFDEKDVPAHCPGCGAPRSQFLEEPFTGDIEKRRIHVDPPTYDPNRDPHDISFHVSKDFAPQKGDGRNRRFVMSYDAGKADEMIAFYKDLFGWDIIQTKDTVGSNDPTFFCATGPSTPDWEPRICSFSNGYLKPKTSDEPDDSIIIEVKDIEKTLEKVKKFGGKVIKERFTRNGETYAIVEDSEGNQLYIWECKDTEPDYCTNPVTNLGAQ